MPLDTSSDSWTSSSVKDSTKSDILDFLNSNPDQAFTPEEISRELLDTDFDIDVPEEKLPAEKQLGQALASIQYISSTEAFIKTHLSALVYEDEVEVRRVLTEVDGEEVELGYYSIRD